MTPLSEHDIQTALHDLPGWTYTNGTLAKTYTLADFAAAMALVNGAAEIAEEQGHHPDIDIRYNRVIFVLSTHDAGSVVTAKDVAVARAIEEQSRIDRTEVN